MGKPEDHILDAESRAAESRERWISMRRITIKRDEYGSVSVVGGEDPRSDFYRYALSKVIDGKFKEISYVPIDQTFLVQKEE